MSIAENLERVRARIVAAAAASGRDAATIRLVAVSKKNPSSAIREAYAAGQRDFGENYVQELVEKSGELADLDDLRFHLIGHLQRNKAKAVVGTRASVQTLDSIRLADALARAATSGARPIEVHVQVNIAEEPQKSGCSVTEVPALVAAIRGLPELSLVGLMTVPPAGDPESARVHYRALASLAARFELTSLSMGMSADLGVAVSEGATLVRVGTAIFGDRS